MSLIHSNIKEENYFIIKLNVSNILPELFNSCDKELVFDNCELPCLRLFHYIVVLILEFNPKSGFELECAEWIQTILNFIATSSKHSIYHTVPFCFLMHFIEIMKKNSKQKMSILNRNWISVSIRLCFS